MTSPRIKIGAWAKNSPELWTFLTRGTREFGVGSVSRLRVTEETHSKVLAPPDGSILMFVSAIRAVAEAYSPSW